MGFLTITDDREVVARILCSSSPQRGSVELRSGLSVQASRVLPHQTASSTPLWTFLCALVCSHGTGRGHRQTVPANLGA